MTKGRTINIAHITEIVGQVSEALARTALICAGWTVAKTETRESFDIVARDPLTAEWKTFQVKTIKLRSDRRNEMVVYARKGNGEAYTQPEAEYIIGVLGAKEAEAPRVWVFENTGLGEYWATEASAERRWIELPLSIQREVYTHETPAGTVEVAA
ncbi:hypothetical protein [Paenibacillus sp. SN-8-1]|uniref:hypothetical protein n=1 Tax=Paenibacillus sp. SN-8-1 TaxID=3435409 RepID=UPI003D9A8657